MTDQSYTEGEELYPEAAVKRYNVSATRTSYVSVSFDTVEEALAKVHDLIAQGYPGVSFRDHESKEELW